MICRKNVNTLTAQERQDFVDAVLALKANGKYNQYVQMHQAAMDKATPPSVLATVRNAAHRGPAFFPWHREFLRRFEEDLRLEVPGVALPYWDWAADSQLPDPATGTVWSTDLLGGDGDPNDNDYVKTGPFRYDPNDPQGWTIADTNGNDTGDGLQRDFGVSASTLPTPGDVTTGLGETPYDTDPWHRSSNPSFRNRLEGWIDGPQLHNRVHVWVGGSMMPGTSPNDPVFFLHHCFVDKLWADWQAQHPSEPFVPGDGESADLDGHRLSDAMFPWSTTVADMLDHRALDYIYDTDPTVVTLVTPSLAFDNVPEGLTTVRAAVFEVSSCENVTFQVTAGPSVLTGPPGTQFDTPLGTQVTFDPHADIHEEHARVWISYTGTTAGDTATGTVTIHCVETNEDFVIPISAETIAKRTVASVLVLDKSGSMDFDAGDGRKRIDVLKEAAPVFVELLGDQDGIGVVSFDHDATKELDVTLAGPPSFGGGRVQAKGEISAHQPNPQGNTSIGDGLDLGQSVAGAAVGYDDRALVVLTDGQENAAQYIADVIGNIAGSRVFGIGLGSAEQINPDALTALTNGTGGYVLMTGNLGVDDHYILQKYYLQILAGVTNTEVVLDPEGIVAPGSRVRIPFDLSDADVAADVILLSPVPAQVLRFQLETPAGDVIDPGVAATLPSATFAVGAGLQFYRLTLPLPLGIGAREGGWHALLHLDRQHHSTRLPEVRDDVPGSSDLRHGASYSLNVHTRSNARMRAALSQDSLAPGATFTLRASLAQFGLPLTTPATVRAELRRPDGARSTLVLEPAEQGVYQTEWLGSQSGIYSVRVLAEGRTFRGRRLTREQLVTGAVWPGGDRPFPTGENDPSIRDERWCAFIRCLLSDERVAGWLCKQDLDAELLRRCLKQLCRP